MATREQLKQAILQADAAGDTESAQRFAEMYKAAPAVTAKPATFLSTAGRAAYNLPMDTAETLKGVMMSPVAAVKAVATREGREGVKSWMNNAADVLKGGVQHVREMSPEAYRGSAPVMDTGAYDKFAAETKDKYGTKAGIYKVVGDHPAGVALAAAALIDPALRAAQVDGGLVGATDRGLATATAPVRKSLTALKARTVDPVTSRVNRVVTAERTGNAAAATMRDEAANAFKGGQTTAEQEAAALETRSADAAASATRGRRFAGTLAERRAAAAKAAIAPEPDFAPPHTLSELGDATRTPALAKQGEIEAEMKAAYDEHMANTKAIGEARANKGEGVGDGPVAKSFLQEVKERVSPDPISRKPVSSILDPKAGGAAHRRVLDVLSPTRHPIGADQVKRAAQQGHKVFTDPMGQNYIVTKPGIEALENLRREIGDTAHGRGEAHGFGAVSQENARYLYKKLNDVMDEYAMGAHASAREAWRVGKQKLEDFEKIKAGQNVVGMQGATDTAAVPAANIPGRVLAGGRDTIQQTAAVAGQAPVNAIVRSQVQNAFTGKSATEVESLLRGTKLGDVVAADPELSERVASYTQRLKRSEAAGSTVTSLEKRAQVALQRSDRLAKRSSTTAERAAKAKEIARGYERNLADLEIAAPSDVGKQYTSMLERAHAANHIDTAKYQQGIKLAAQAEKAFKLKNSRDKWLRLAGYYAGLGAAGALGVDVVRTLEH